MTDSLHLLTVDLSHTPEAEWPALATRIDGEFAALADKGDSVGAVILADTPPHSAAGYGLVGALVEGLQNSALERFTDVAEFVDLPPVLWMPSLHDRVPRAVKSMLNNALTRDWPDTEELIRLDSAQDVFEEVGRQYAQWQEWTAAHGVGFEAAGALSGLLPGEGSLTLERGGRSYGIVCVNSAFRMVTAEAAASLAHLTREQLDAAVGGDWDAWASSCEASMIFAPYTAALPDDRRGSGHVFLVAARSGTAAGLPSAAWQVTSESNRSFHLLRLTPTGDGPVVHARDLTARRDLTPVAVAPQNTMTAAVPSEQANYDLNGVIKEAAKHIAAGRVIAMAVSGLNESEGTGPLDCDRLNVVLNKAVFGTVVSPMPPLAETWRHARKTLTADDLAPIVDGLRSRGPVPTAVRLIHRGPWFRVYDFTGSDAFAHGLQQVVRDEHRRRVVDSTVDLLQDDDSLQFVAMYGRPDAEPHTLDFADGGDGGDCRANWWRQFVAEAAFHPQIYFASSISSLELWRIINSVGDCDQPRIVVAPEGGVADRMRLKQAGLEHVRMTPEEFCRRVLAPGNECVEAGWREIIRARRDERAGAGVTLLSQVMRRSSGAFRALRSFARAGATNAQSMFLHGEEPTWDDIVQKGGAAELDLKSRILRATEPNAVGLQPIVLVNGRAGSGKSTALMQAAVELHQRSLSVGWVDRRSTDGRRAIEEQCLETDLQAVFVDDVEIFQNNAASFLQTLNRNGKVLVVASIRNTRRDVVDVTFEPREVSADEELSDSDLNKLVEVLRKNGKLGILKDKGDRKVEELRRMCERNLLSAMIQVVSGRGFDEKIKSEFDQLEDKNSRHAYLVVSLLESEQMYKQRGVNEVDLVRIISDGTKVDARAKRSIDRLVTMRLLAKSGSMIYTRHRAIGDSVLDQILKKRQDTLLEILIMVLVFYAQRSTGSRSADDPNLRVFVRLINHRLMHEFFTDLRRPRLCYSSVQKEMDDNFHYWLQRAQFEFEFGSLEAARNYLESAERSEHGATDYRVQTLRGEVELKESLKTPTDSSQREVARNALRTLDEVSRVKGSSSPQTYSVLVRLGYEWLKECQKYLDDREFFDDWQRISDSLQRGQLVCKDNLVFVTTAERVKPLLATLKDAREGLPL
jgi:hypothetical protein